MRFAALADMEPGFWFRPYRGARPVAWLGVVPVVSRFAGRRRVRVLCAPGPGFVAEFDDRFEVVDFTRGGGRRG